MHAPTEDMTHATATNVYDQGSPALGISATSIDDPERSVISRSRAATRVWAELPR